MDRLPVALAEHLLEGGVVGKAVERKKAGTREMDELSLAIRSPKGLAVMVGCSHPGVENILVAAAQIDKQLYSTIGGFHLMLTPGEEIERVANMLHDTLGLQSATIQARPAVQPCVRPG